MKETAQQFAQIAIRNTDQSTLSILKWYSVILTFFRVGVVEHVTQGQYRGLRCYRHKSISAMFSVTWPHTALEQCRWRYYNLLSIHNKWDTDQCRAAIQTTKLSQFSSFSSVHEGLVKKNAVNVASSQACCQTPFTVTVRKKRNIENSLATHADQSLSLKTLAIPCMVWQ